ncbi:MAG TPA: ABC transporter permease [Chitinophagaceae bacterium]|nr:ABC transporter permease [Chitinophagaceae bacterium]
MDKPSKWEWEIRPYTKWFRLNLGELVAYRDLLFRLVRRDFLMLYQQTLLGPVWIILQPVLTVLTYILIFDKILGISTNNIPPLLFYLTGITLWNLFSDVFMSTTATFVGNASIFSKVYFPRMIMPLSSTLLHITRFLVQALLLVAMLLFYHFTGRYPLSGNWLAALLPVVMAAMMGLGVGLTFSVLTAKYRDLMNLLHLAMRLLMFVCPIFFSVSAVPENLAWITYINPLAPLFEMFRAAFLGSNAGTFTAMQLLFSAAVTIIVLLGGMALFNKKADTLMDVV